MSAPTITSVRAYVVEPGNDGEAGGSGPAGGADYHAQARAHWIDDQVVAVVARSRAELAEQGDRIVAGSGRTPDGRLGGGPRTSRRRGAGPLRYRHAWPAGRLPRRPDSTRRTTRRFPLPGNKKIRLGTGRLTCRSGLTGDVGPVDTTSVQVANVAPVSHTGAVVRLAGAHRPEVPIAAQRSGAGIRIRRPVPTGGG